MINTCTLLKCQAVKTMSVTSLCYVNATMMHSLEYNAI